jgi:ferredoxin-NADP reductase
LARELYTARLLNKTHISESSDCYHLDFVIEDLEYFPFLSGQFISAVATDPNGKQQTRAYSIASAPNANRFELCVNRVSDGFFSSHIVDLTDMPPGDTIQIHGPHGHFILKQPIADSILISAGTGIAPMRAFVQWLFPETGPDAGLDRSEGKDIWMLFGTCYESDLYYRDEFEVLAARRPNFHYLPALSRVDVGWKGLRGYVQEHVGQIIEERARRLGQALPALPPDPSIPASELRFDIHAYVCGLNDMVSAVREKLAGFGWHRKQIVFERYD